MVRTWIAGALVALAGTAATIATATPDAPDIAGEAPSDTGVTTIEVAPSGNLRKDLGESAGVTLPGSDRAHFEVIVHEIAVVDSCPGRVTGAERTPERSHFVVVDLTARMSDSVATDVLGGADLFMPLSPDAFALVGQDGSVRTDLLTDAAWACFEDDVLAAPFVGPGEGTSGYVVLDSDVDSGVLVYAPAGPGWEWEFGR